MTEAPALSDAILPTLFLEILVVTPNPDTIRPKTGLAAPEEEILVTVLPVIFPVVVAALKPVCNAFTCPPAVKFDRVFPEIVCVGPPLLVPALRAKITPPPVRFESVLFETVVPPPEKL